jgi:hypothetical protein
LRLCIAQAIVANNQHVGVIPRTWPMDC